MKLVALSVFLVGSMAASAVLAAAPSGAPGGSMGMCKDGTYSSSAEKKGACRGHKGAKDWYSDEAPAKPGSLPATRNRAIATPAPGSNPQNTTPAATHSRPAKVPKPQSVEAITRTRSPTVATASAMRRAPTCGCSTKWVVVSITQELSGTSLGSGLGTRAP